MPSNCGYSSCGVLAMKTKWFARIVLGIIFSPVILGGAILCWPLPVIVWLFENAGFKPNRDGWLFAGAYTIVQLAWIAFLIALFGG
jgi:hypothetical protein